MQLLSQTNCIILKKVDIPFYVNFFQDNTIIFTSVSADEVALDVAGRGVEIYAEADNLLVLHLEGQHIVFVADLRQSLLGGAVQLELYHIAVVLRLHHQIDASTAGVVLCLHIEAQQLEQ